MTSPFDFVKSVGRTKEDLLATGVEASAYRPFIVNRSLSFRADAILQAQMMNERHWIDEDQQYYFMLSTVPASKSYSPWLKAEAAPEALDAIMFYYGYSAARALEALEILDEETIAHIQRQHKIAQDSKPAAE